MTSEKSNSESFVRYPITIVVGDKNHCTPRSPPLKNTLNKILALILNAPISIHFYREFICYMCLLFPVFSKHLTFYKRTKHLHYHGRTEKDGTPVIGWETSDMCLIKSHKHKRRKYSQKSDHLSNIEILT